MCSEGGPFSFGAEVELGAAAPAPDPPETEDHRFAPTAARFVRSLAPEEFLELVEEHCEDDLESIFGPDLLRMEWNYAVNPGTGKTSLGCLRVQERPYLEVSSYGRLTLRFNDPEKPAYLPVNDLRFYETDHRTVKGDLVADVSARIRRDVPVRLMVGLARAWTAPNDDRPRHWLQVNGICLEDDPLEDHT